jgi:hypothetical protein
MEIPFRKMMPKDKMLHRYVDGIIAVDSLLYVSIYDYDWNLPRLAPYFDSIRPRLENYDPFKSAPEPMLSHMFFTSAYSKNYGIAGIIKSTDMGKTWTNVPDANTPRFLGPRFAGLTFLNFGPGYSDVPNIFRPMFMLCRTTAVGKQVITFLWPVYIKTVSLTVVHGSFYRVSIIMSQPGPNQRRELPDFYRSGPHCPSRHFL